MNLAHWCNENATDQITMRALINRGNDEPSTLVQ
jgi:hypothetical protein